MQNSVSAFKIALIFFKVALFDTLEQGLRVSTVVSLFARNF